MHVGLDYVWCGDTMTTAEPALILAHRKPRWHWWGPETWFAQLLGLSIAVYTSVLSDWCQGGMGTHISHPAGAGNQLGVKKSKSGQEICNPGSFTWEEILPFCLSICDTSVLQNPPKNRSWEPYVPGEPLILPMETAGHLGVLLRAWGMRHGSLQLECLPHWRITHSVWVPARSQMAGCCLTGLGILLQVQICKSWHIPFSCKQQSPSWAAKHAEECPPLHLAFWYRSGTSSHDISRGHLLLVTRERKKWRKDKNPSYFMFLTSSF